MNKKRAFLFLLSFVVCGIAVAGTRTISKSENVALKGTLVTRDFLNEANEKIEKYFVLLLPAPIDVTFKDELVCPDGPTKNITEIMLVVDFAEEGKKYLGKEVQVKGNLFYPHTAHHHTKVLMQVESIEAYYADHYIIHEKGVGEIHLGMDIKKVGKYFSGSVLTIQKGFDAEEGYHYETACLAYDNCDNGLVATFSMLKNKITSMTFFSYLFRTEQDIGVGSKIFEVIKQYPDYILHYEGEPVFRPKGSNISFGFSTTKEAARYFIDGISKYPKYKRANIPVTYIRVE